MSEHYRVSDFDCNGFPIAGRATLVYMKPKRERSPFGERVFQARTRAKLTQPQLAKLVGMAQSTLGELEYIGIGSSFTAQIAKACGVTPEWLSEGVGPMVDTPLNLLPEILAAAAEVNALPQKQREWALRHIQEVISLAKESLTLASNGNEAKVENDSAQVNVRKYR